jgi:cell division protein FtsZ
MTIIRDGRNRNGAKEFAIIGVGGAGSKSATELSKLLGNPEDVISVDRDMDDLRSLNVGRRISIGYPVFPRNDDNRYEGEVVDANDLFRLKTVIGRPPIVFVMAGLGGNATLELMPAVLRTAMSTGASVLAIVTLPFSFEGRTRTETARRVLKSIRETGCSLALINADNALPTAAAAGALASELSAAKARVVMNVLSAASAETFGTLNAAPELLDAIKCGGETFVSHSTGENVDEYRKIARGAIKSPITSGLALGDADRVSVVVAGPPDMSIKALNSALSIVQKELSPEAALSTSFVPNGDSANANRLRISILAGKRTPGLSDVEEAEGESEDSRTFESADAHARETDQGKSINDDVDDLFGAPDWLVDQPNRDSKVPVLL